METHFSALSVLLFRTTSINYWHTVKIVYSSLWLDCVQNIMPESQTNQWTKGTRSRPVIQYPFIFCTLFEHVILHWLSEWTLPLSALKQHLLLTPAMVRSAFDFCHRAICTAQQLLPAAMTLPFSHSLMAESWKGWEVKKKKKKGRAVSEMIVIQ